MTETHTSTTAAPGHPGDLTGAKAPAKKAAARKRTPKKAAEATTTRPTLSTTDEAAGSSLGARVAATWVKANEEADRVRQDLAEAQADAARWASKVEELEEARDAAEAAWAAGDIDAFPDAPTPSDLERVALAAQGAERRLKRASRATAPTTDQRVANLLAPIARQHQRIPVFVVPEVPDTLTPADLDSPAMFVMQQSPTIDHGDGSVGLSTYTTPHRRAEGEPIKIVLVRDELFAPLDGQALRHRLNAARIKIKENAFGRIMAADPIIVTTYPSESVEGMVEDVARFEILSTHPAVPTVPKLSDDDYAQRARDWVCGGIARKIQFNWAPGTGAVERNATSTKAGVTTDTFRMRLVLQLPKDVNDDQAEWRINDLVRDDLGALIPGVGTISAASVESVRREVRSGTENFHAPSFDLTARVIYSVTRSA